MTSFDHLDTKLTCPVCGIRVCRTLTRVPACFCRIIGKLVRLMQIRYCPRNGNQASHNHSATVPAWEGDCEFLACQSGDRPVSAGSYPSFRVAVGGSANQDRLGRALVTPAANRTYQQYRVDAANHRRTSCYSRKALCLALSRQAY